MPEEPREDSSAGTPELRRSQLIENISQLADDFEESHCGYMRGEDIELEGKFISRPEALRTFAKKLESFLDNPIMFADVLLHFQKGIMDQVRYFSDGSENVTPATRFVKVANYLRRRPAQDLSIRTSLDIDKGEIKAGWRRWGAVRQYNVEDGEKENLINLLNKVITETEAVVADLSA